jgi:hypothetical protein
VTGEKLRYLMVFCQIWAFIRETLYLSPKKREKKMNPFHTVFLSWSSQQEVIYVLEECKPCWSAEKALRSDVKAVPKVVGKFLKSCSN